MADAAETGKKTITPNITIDEEVSELDPETGLPRVRSRASSTRSKAKLPMPSKQCKKTTEAYNELVRLRRAGSVEAVAHQAVKKLEDALHKLHEELALVVPEDELQAHFKESWIAQNVTRKEMYVLEARQALYEEQERRKQQEQEEYEAELRHQHDDALDRASLTSSMRRAAIEVEEEEARLRVAQQQLQQRHERQRRQQEQERKMREQDERDELEQKLAGLQAKKDALLKFGSAASGSASNKSKSRLPILPAVRQPTQEWLRQSQEGLDAASFVEQGHGPAQRQEPVSQTPSQPTDALFQHLLLSQASLPKFKGDHLEYPYFRLAFEVQVEQITRDAARKLFLLMQQLEGEPYMLVKACQLAPSPQEGLARAKQLLEERYGNPVKLSLEFLNKLATWPPVKTGSDLAAFSIQLQLGEEMKRVSPGLLELDSAATMRSLVSRLPTKLRTSWQTKVVDIEHTRSINFSDLVEFVKRRERAWNHPVFGNTDSQTGAKDGRSIPDKATTFSTTVCSDDPKVQEGQGQEAESREDGAIGEPGVAALATATPPNAFKAPCLFCGDNHPTSKCPTALSRTREERKEALRGLCFACLKPGHSARNCKARLKCQHCQKLHPTVLHENRDSAETNEHSPDTEVKESNLMTAITKQCLIASLPAKVWLTGDISKAVTARALLDSASTATFITPGLAQKLKATPTPISLMVTTLEGKRRIPAGVVHDLRLADPEGNETLSVPLVYVVDSLPTAPKLSEADVAPWPHLAELPFDWSGMDGPVDMLVGQSAPRAVTPCRAIHAGDHEPYAVKTALGWALQGTLTTGQQAVPAAAYVVQVTGRPDVELHLARLFYQDFDGVHDFTTKGLSLEDRKWIQRVSESTVRGDDSHYLIDLPFKENTGSLKNNYSQALQRLHSLQRKFVRNEQFKVDYVAFMNKMIEAGHVERVFDTESCPGGPSQVINYVPHHGVYHPCKPNKIRVVFNCASKFRGTSLNDCLLPGPDLTNSIIGVLLRFRQYRVAVMADIEAMFYQVRVPEAQRDALRFLWWPGEDPDIDSDPAIYRMKVHLFGATSSPSVANFALRKAADEAMDSAIITQRTRDIMYNSFYVDDCLRSTPSDEEALREANELIRACQFGGFRLTQFISTSTTVLKNLDKTLLARELTNVDLSEDKNDPLGSLQQRALGVAWDVTQDALCFKIAPETSGPQCHTKRSVLSKLSQLYDPLGMAAPVVIAARIFFRQLTISTSDWDLPLTEEEQRKWNEWLTALPQLEQVVSPRCIWPEALTEKGRPEIVWEMHVFCDASRDAYAAVVYLRKSENGKAATGQVKFVFGKARVSPPKVVTIPRLELMAAKLAVEVANTVQSSLEISIQQRHFWTDSETVLKYLYNTSKRFHTFVANRIHAILSLSEAKEWRYVPTTENPADVGSRGIRADRLHSSSWLTGPAFLSQPTNTWPRVETIEEIALKDPEVRSSATALAVASTGVEETPQPWVEQLAERYSSAAAWRRALAVWLRWHQFITDKKFHKDPLQAPELRKAEHRAVSWLQRETWPIEYQKLAAHEGIPKTSSLYRLNPVLEDGLILLGSRVRRKVPILPTGAVSKLLVREGHERRGHMGRNATMADVNERYWIVGLNKLTRQEIRSCPRCQLTNAVPKPTIMAELPNFRFESCQPFETTGVDYFGPFTVRRKKEYFKVYGVLFTCAVSRAVHLEMSEGLSSQSFINALQRFRARRGHVKLMLSDNGTNFAGAKARLQDDIKTELQKLQESGLAPLHMRKLDVEWRFNPPGASHFGGFWERLIGIIRKCLTNLGGKGVQNVESFATLLCECESILNQRPLTTCSTDLNDFEPLTPNHILIGSAQSLESFSPAPYVATALALRNQWKRVQHNANQFWKRFQSEYVRLLNVRTKWFERNKRALAINDVVLVADVPNRDQWKLGRIIRVYQSASDHQVRVADVRTQNGTYTRPIIKLCLLEAASAV